VSSGQRVSLASVEDVRVVERGGVSYIFYQAVSRGGPNFVDPKAATYRRSAGVIARRDDFYYTLAGTCPERLWGEVEPLFSATLESFRLEDTESDKSYRSPDESPFNLF
jgi:hypothetical protein